MSIKMYCYLLARLLVEEVRQTAYPWNPAKLVSSLERNQSLSWSGGKCVDHSHTHRHLIKTMDMAKLAEWQVIAPSSEEYRDQKNGFDFGQNA